MSKVAHLPAAKNFGLSDNQLALVRRTIAPDLRPDEFNLFVEQCRVYGLNPVSKQIYAVVYNAKNEDKRNVTLIVGINGLRSIADRTGRYRPDAATPRYEADPDLKSKTNPHGLVRAEVTVYKADARGEWFPVTDEAYWDEYAPLEQEWAYDPEQRKRAPTGEEKLGGMWGKMPRAMLAKVAEARALRKAFPELSGLHSDDEMAQADAQERNLTAAEIVEEEERAERQARLGSERAILFIWSALDPQEAVPVSKVEGRLMDFYRRDDLTPDFLDWFTSANRESLKQFWSEKPEEALGCKAAREAAAERAAERERQEADEADAEAAEGDAR